MLHDNARPHTVAATQDLIATFDWEQFDHSPFNPDLAPSDFHVFLHVKCFLGDRRFHDDEVKEDVNTWFASQAGIQNWCPTTTSTSTLVETTSKSGVRYVHQMAIYS
jgi:hypothetical protein